MLTALLLLLLLVACGTTASSEEESPDPAELQARIARLRSDLAAATERSEALAGEVEELRAGQDALQERVGRLEGENARLQANLDAIVDVTGSSSPEDALAEIESLLIEVESLRELAEDQRFLQRLLESLGRGAGADAPSPEPPQREAAPHRPEPEGPEPERPEPGAPTRPLGELPAGTPRTREADRSQSAGGTPAQPTRILGGFLLVDRLESSFIAGARPLPEDSRISVTTDRRRTYLPTVAATDASIVAPIVRDGGDPEPAVLVKVRYSASDPPLYLRGVELSTQSTSTQITLPEVRRVSTGSERLEEALVTDAAAVRRLMTLLASESAVTVSYHGYARSIREDAPRDARGVVAVMVYVLQALGGKLPWEGDPR
ncbi:MAG: hypothetical protein ACLFO1_09695 [Spirochaetaceae bacterium]